MAGVGSLSYSPLSSLSPPQGSLTVKLGTEGIVWDWVRFSDQHLEYLIYKSSSGEKAWFLTEFSVRIKKTQSKTWLPGNLGYSLFFKKWDW